MLSNSPTIRPNDNNIETPCNTLIEENGSKATGEWLLANPGSPISEPAPERATIGGSSDSAPLEVLTTKISSPMASTSYLPLSEDDATLDELTWPDRVLQEIKNYSSTGSSTGLHNAGQQIRRALVDEYSGAGVRMDALHVGSGNYFSTFTGRVSYSLSPVEDVVNNLMRETFRHVYYLAMLDVKGDNSVLSCNSVISNLGNKVSNAANNTTENKIENCMGIQTVHRQQSTTRRAKRRAGHITGEAAIAEQRMLEERKKRNRLSAARSNARKRAWEASMQKELEQNRELQKELSDREQKLKNENSKLRAALQGPGGKAGMDVIEAQLSEAVLCDVDLIAAGGLHGGGGLMKAEVIMGELVR